MNRQAMQAIMDAMGGDDHAVRLDPEAQLMRLREAAPRFIPVDGRQPLPFSVGDIVTPRTDSNVKGDGNPHIVVEANPEAAPSWHADVGSPEFGARFNMRVLCIMGGDIAAFWVEAANFEPYPTT